VRDAQLIMDPKPKTKSEAKDEVANAIALVAGLGWDRGLRDDAFVRSRVPAPE